MFKLTQYPIQLPNSHGVSRGIALQTLCSASMPDTGTPLLSAVRERAERTAQAPFHIPGHKQGRGAGVLPEFLGMMGPALKHDLTELPGGCMLLNHHLSLVNVLLASDRLAMLLRLHDLVEPCRFKGEGWIQCSITLQQW